MLSNSQSTSRRLYSSTCLSICLSLQLLGLPLDASPLSLLFSLFVLCYGPTTALPPGVLNKARRMIGTPSARAEYVVSLLQASGVLAQVGTWYIT
jgi:hypothetical protein